ncbi:methyl-accepting chemotaxis protein [Sulfuritortus calidifontis]|uniref:Methyl-accepting chemotaxis protein n=1 Tax=Sulfuritortus calidifontis TaxID=1914471 RepID=A0A4R3JWW2_9PROT|nr:methyl-accepting chemotaxis protein [Sulfuritortus calidifontis]TCS72763.1 methyl-accepting chemotaxis protein [Sulfuritortus calidifontis]
MTTTIDEERVLQPGRVAADRVMLGTLAFLLVVSLGVAAVTSTWAVALIVGIPALAVPFALFKMNPGSLVSRIAMACAFMIFSALTIQQTRGMIEAHFGIFVLLAFLLYYRDWRPIVAAAGVIAVHHLAFNYMQAAGMGVYVLFNGPNLGIIILHAVYVVVETAVLVYMAVKLRTEAIESAQVASLAEHIGQGDLTQALHDKALAGRPLLTKIVDMQKQLIDTLGKVNAQARQLAGTTQRMASQSQEVDNAMDRQSESTSAIAATIEQLTVSINHLSEGSAEAARLAQQSAQSSNSGSSVVRSTISEIRSIADAIGTLSKDMDQLGTQFDNITSVVGLIKDIADQTNLLALNASIEAARAGEQGRGFAVVADEVRKLAERARQATEEISRTIDDIQTSKGSALGSIEQAVKRASAGVELASSAGKSIETISQDVQEVQRVVEDISNALREQTVAASDIARNIEQVTAMAQASSQAANNVRDNSDDLNRIAQEMAQSVVRFRLP